MATAITADAADAGDARGGSGGPAPVDDLALVAHRLLDSVAVIAGGAHVVRTASLVVDERDHYLERIEAHAQLIGDVLSQLARGGREGALAALLAGTAA
jgi:hypothetical protein